MTSTEPRAPRYDPDVEYIGFAVSAADGRAGRVDGDTDEVSPWQLVVRLGPRAGAAAAGGAYAHGRRR